MSNREEISKLTGPSRMPDDTQKVEIVELDIPFLSILWTCFKVFVALGLLGALAWLLRLIFMLITSSI